MPELVAVIDEYIAQHNTNPKPFISTKSACEILRKIVRGNSCLSSEQNATAPWEFWFCITPATPHVDKLFKDELKFHKYKLLCFINIAQIHKNQNRERTH